MKPKPPEKPLRIRLRLARAMHGHTQEQAAMYIGCGHNTFVRWEISDRKPRALYRAAAERYIEAAEKSS